MRCISIHQPWAEAILHLGKTVENRTWPTNHRGPLLIHAAKSRASYDAWPADVWRAEFRCDRPEWDTLAKGAVVGVVHLIDCIPITDINLSDRDSDRLWAQGPFCWQLRQARAFAKPIGFRGQQGLFDVPDDMVGEAIRLSEFPMLSLRHDPVDR
jgi:hypothetical protein